MNPNRLVARYGCRVPSGRRYTLPLRAEPAVPIDRTGTEETTLYAGAHPYLNDPLPKFGGSARTQETPTDLNQDGLPDLMARVGATTSTCCGDSRLIAVKK